jgi:hypothetical protein
VYAEVKNKGRDGFINLTLSGETILCRSARFTERHDQFLSIIQPPIDSIRSPPIYYTIYSSQIKGPGNFAVSMDRNFPLIRRAIEIIKE